MNRLANIALACLLVAGCSAGAAQPPVGVAAPPTGVPPAPTGAPAAPTASPRPTVAPSPAVTPPAPTLPPEPSLAATPGVTPSPSPTAAAEAEPYSINLYREGAFVSQYTKYWCLPAAMQTMINMMSDGPLDTSEETQERLYWQARDLSTETLRPNGKGAQPEGWANSLNAEGYGPYAVRVEPTLKEAVVLAARQIRLTGKPVGLLTWRGAHSWSMSGFEASADPAVTDDVEVTGVWVQDVWWPRVSTIWGESDEPNTLVPIGDLREDYRKYRRPYRKFPDKDGRYVLVVPLAPDQG